MSVDMSGSKKAINFRLDARPGDVELPTGITMRTKATLEDAILWKCLEALLKNNRAASTE